MIFLIPQESFADHTNQTYSIPINATHNATVPCFATTESNMCGFFSNPWSAAKHAFFVDYLGEWFIAIVYFPIIAVVYLLTRDGRYTGLVGLFVVAGTNQADTLPVEIALTLVTISAGFGFFEAFRKRVME